MWRFHKLKEHDLASEYSGAPDIIYTSKSKKQSKAKSSLRPASSYSVWRGTAGQSPVFPTAGQLKKNDSSDYARLCKKCMGYVHRDDN